MSKHVADVAELRRCLTACKLEPYRFLNGSEVPWEASPAGTDHSLRRFLIARKGDIFAAMTMFQEHLVWRRAVFPIVREGVVQTVLDDGRRFARIGTNADGMQVLLVNFLWGYFLDGISALDCLRATIFFIETEIATGESLGIRQAYIISYGGPPPLDYAAALAATLEANYPERLARAVIYPVPRLVSKFVKMMLWILDKDTSAKVKIEFDERELLSLMNVDISQLPSFMQGGLDAVEPQLHQDSHARMHRLIREGIYGGRGAAADLQRQLILQKTEVVASKVLDATPATVSWRDALCCCVYRGENIPATAIHRIPPPSPETVTPLNCANGLAVSSKRLHIPLPIVFLIIVGVVFAAALSELLLKGGSSIGM